MAIFFGAKLKMGLKKSQGEKNKAVLLIFSILTFFVTFVKVDVSCNDFCQSLFATPVPQPFFKLEEISQTAATRAEAARIVAKSIKPNVTPPAPAKPTVKHPFEQAETTDLGIIKFPLPDFLKKTKAQ